MKKIIQILLSAFLLTACSQHLVAANSTRAKSNAPKITAEDAAAFEQTKKAAEQGDITAQFNLAMMYSNGKGVNKNHPEAFKWCKKAAEQGYVDAQALLALIYRFGSGVEMNNTESLVWSYVVKDVKDNITDESIKEIIDVNIKELEKLLDAKTVEQSKQRAREIQKKIAAKKPAGSV